MRHFTFPHESGHDHQERAAHSYGQYSSQWDDFPRHQASRLSIRYVDLLQSFRELPNRELKALFLTPDEHLSSAGNYKAASVLLQALGSGAILTTRLSSRGP